MTKKTTQQSTALSCRSHIRHLHLTLVQVSDLVRSADSTGLPIMHIDCGRLGKALDTAHYAASIHTDQGSTAGNTAEQGAEMQGWQRYCCSFTICCCLSLAMRLCTPNITMIEQA